MAGILELLKSNIALDRILTDEPMNRHTTFKIGGPADIMVLPENAGEIKYILNACAETDTRYIIMGNGSNLLVSDRGIRGVVIKIGSHFSKVICKDGVITANAGILLSSLSKYAQSNGLAGLEFAEGIPGTLGGAVAMNAGAYDNEIKDILVYAEVLAADGHITSLTNLDMGFGYRASVVQNNGGIVLSVVFKLNEDEQGAIQARMDEYRRKRKEKQPLDLPSAGSIFKRPPNNFAGRLIEDSGLRGYSVGGAQVSEKHCGFIVNKGGAAADDVIKLIGHIKNVVFEKFGIELETEVKLVGE